MSWQLQYFQVSSAATSWGKADSAGGVAAAADAAATAARRANAAASVPTKVSMELGASFVSSVACRFRGCFEPV